MANESINGPKSDLDISDVSVRYFIEAMFSSLDALIMRNRAYHTVLLGFAGESNLKKHLDKVQDAVRGAYEPPIYNALRDRAIQAAQDRNLDEFVSLAREVSDRTRAWL
jgi:hypothetical protein